MFNDGTLAIVELKWGTSSEDRRIGLIEGLIYTAIVEANIAQIAREIRIARQHAVKHNRPRILLIAPPNYWSRQTNYPSSADLAMLTRDIMSLIPIDIALLSLQNVDPFNVGLNGRPSTLLSPPILEYVIGAAERNLKIGG